MHFIVSTISLEEQGLLICFHVLKWQTLQKHLFLVGVFMFSCVQISVEDADEPPVFTAPSYTFVVEENAPQGTRVGQVHAKDTDVANNPVR